MNTFTNNRTLNISLWVAQVILGGLFLMVGIMKVSTPLNELVKTLNWPAEVPLFMIRFIGFSEVFGGLGLLLPSLLRIKPILTPIAASGFVTVMLMAAGFHLSRGEFGSVLFSLVLGGLALYVAWGRFRMVPVLARA